MPSQIRPENFTTQAHEFDLWGKHSHRISIQVDKDPREFWLIKLWDSSSVVDGFWTTLEKMPQEQTQRLIAVKLAQQVLTPRQSQSLHTRQIRLVSVPNRFNATGSAELEQAVADALKPLSAAQTIGVDRDAADAADEYFRTPRNPMSDDEKTHFLKYVNKTDPEDDGVR